MIDGRYWLRQGLVVGGLVRDTFRRGHGQPSCPRCLTSRTLGIVRIEIEELPGLPLTEQRDWECRTCHSRVRETVVPD